MIRPQAVILSDNKDNNFKLLRIVLSFLVIFAHSYVIANGQSYKGKDPLERWIGVPLGHLSVNAFFVISGFLITASYLSRNNLYHYLWARILRIYPAYIAATLFCAIIVGTLFTTLPRKEYLRDPQTTIYVTHNLPLLCSGFMDGRVDGHWTNITKKVASSLKYVLPGVFAYNPFPSVVNVPIWTLPWELIMYLSVAIIGLAGLLTRPLVLAVCTIATVIIFFANDRFEFWPSNEIRDLLQFLSFFYLGALVHLFRTKIQIRMGYLALSVFFPAILIGTPCFKYALYLSLVLGVFLFAFLPSKTLRVYNRIGDYSYGMYIYCFPIQQCVAARYPLITPLSLFVAAVAITLPIAVLSWHLLENPLITLGRSRAKI